MPSVASDLRSYLTLDPVLSQLVGDRIHDSKMPQHSRYPAIWYQRTGCQPTHILTGATTDGLARYEFDLEILATTPDEADPIHDRIQTLTSGYTGWLGSRRCQGLWSESTDDDYIPRNDASDEGITATTLRLILWTT